MATYARNTVNLPIGQQVFSVTINPHESNDRKEVTLTSNSNSENTITVKHVFISSINAFKLTDALWSYFGHLNVLETSDEHATLDYIGDYIISESTELSPIITAIFAASKTANASGFYTTQFYGLSITCGASVNTISYKLTDGVTTLTHDFDLQPETTELDQRIRSVDFENGITLIAIIYGENAYLSRNPPLEYEIIKVLR
ncbi:MAG: hypothetical protein V4544_06425 [Pseudomonadota bacterium]